MFTGVSLADLVAEQHDLIIERFVDDAREQAEQAGLDRIELIDSMAFFEPSTTANTHTAAAMTAPADPIQLVQGLPGGPHGADPDRMPGVVQLATGRYDDGRLMAGPAAHTDVVNRMDSDAWRNLLAVITGDRNGIRLAG